MPRPCPLSRLAPVRAWLDDQLALQLAQHAQQEGLGTHSEGLNSTLERLWQALGHTTLLGGKRARPLLIWDAYHALGGKTPKESLLGVMLAIELIHTQSLVFDDLPCMDDDVLRRGHPTLHVAFDEATAVLVGDALACWAFGLLVEQSERSLPPTTTLALVKELSHAASLHGLVNGQMADVLSESGQASLADLQYIQSNKTGALIRFCCWAAGVIVGVEAHQKAALARFGMTLGLLFQLVDDVLDATATTEQLGKTAGKDTHQAKATFVSLLGLAATQERVTTTAAEARQQLQQLEVAGVLQAGHVLGEWIDFFEHRET